ncbi:MAG: hypothetical protein LQ349_004816 [Xanthoria aureola]|nr:MAG: hypothetical protein LQ349_004816 [Xanthoria aureola]
MFFRIAELTNVKHGRCRQYYGNCHCARIKFKTLLPSLDEHEVQVCNCSICSRNGYLHVYVAREEIEWLKGENSMKGYYFGGKQAEHKFCPNCGSSISVDPHGAFGPDWVSINVRMLQDVDLEKMKIKTFDGRNKLEPPYRPD